MRDNGDLFGGLEGGEILHGWMRDLFPICRSLSGPGVRETLAYLKGLMPGLEVKSIASGTKVLDWTVPEEWAIRDAYIADETGRRVVDFRASNLHVVGYSEPVDREMSLDELQPYLYSLPDQPDAIPYITSYYKRRWGFCLTDTARRALRPGRYRARIDSTLAPGELNYAELKIPGTSGKDILVSTYICHPSMANNELSGPVVATALARWAAGLPERRYGLRFVFVPETIGAIILLSRALDELKRTVEAGFVLTCMGDERAWSFLGSRLGGTLADRAALHVLGHAAPGFKSYDFLERGSDERQYCAPNVDLPVVSVMRTKYADYPEYHTSLDDLALVTPRGLGDSAGMMARIIATIEANATYRTLTLGEPQLGPRGLYPDISTKNTKAVVRDMMNTLVYADGTRDVIAIADRIGVPALEVAAIAGKMVQAGVMEAVLGRP
jgi:aminopeptidase-like protein